MRSLLQLSLLAAIVFVLVRFFPIVVQIAEAAALSVRSFWWVILIISLGIWAVSVLRKRNSG